MVRKKTSETTKHSDAEPEFTELSNAEGEESIDSSEPMQNLHSCFLIDIILNL